MPTISTRDARAHLGEVLDRARYAGEETIITKNGTPWAAVVSLDDLRRLRRLEDEADKALMDEIRAEIEAGEEELIPWDEAKKELFD